MGVEDYLLTSTVNAVLAQRLVRTLCHHCREAYTPMDDVVSRWELQRFAGDGPVTLYRAVGCEHCGHTGYSGRNAIVELLVMTDQIKQLILKHSDAGKIAKVAAKSGMHTMLDDGLRKAVAGKTTIEEVRRVTQEQSHTQQLGENPSNNEAAGAMPTEPAEAADHGPATTTGDRKKTDGLLGSHLKTLSRLKRHE
jgi:general secretion pathway protein E